MSEEDFGIGNVPFVKKVSGEGYRDMTQEEKEGFLTEEADERCRRESKEKDRILRDGVILRSRQQEAIRCLEVLRDLGPDGSRYARQNLSNLVGIYMLEMRNIAKEYPGTPTPVEVYNHVLECVDNYGVGEFCPWLRKEPLEVEVVERYRELVHFETLPGANGGYRVVERDRKKGTRITFLDQNQEVVDVELDPEY